MKLKITRRPLGLESARGNQEWVIFRITRQNIERVAAWCGGSVLYSQSHDMRYIEFGDEIAMPGELVGKVAGGETYILNRALVKELFNNLIAVNS